MISQSLGVLLQNGHHFGMAILEGDLQGSGPPLVSRGNVDPRHGQQHTHHINVATIMSGYSLPAITECTGDPALELDLPA